MKTILMILVALAMALDAFPQKERAGLRTNAVMWAIATPNLGVEVATGSRGSLVLGGQHHPFNFSENARIRHTLFTAEQRYWFSQRFDGSFLGVHIMAGSFDLGGKIIDFDPLFESLYDYSFRGQVVGAGLTWGSSVHIAKYWSVEVSFGVGYAYFEYDKYTLKDHRFLKQDNRQYIGPTQLNVALIYWL